MDKVDRSSFASAEVQDGSAAVARSVERDFNELIAIFEGQLAKLDGSENVTRRHIAAAKAAAERGLKLSKELIETLGA